MAMNTFLTRDGIRAGIYYPERTAMICGAVTIDGYPVNCRRVAVSRSKKHEKSAIESGLYAQPIFGFPGYFLLRNAQEDIDPPVNSLIVTYGSNDAIHRVEISNGIFAVSIERLRAGGYRVINLQTTPPYLQAGKIWRNLDEALSGYPTAFMQWAIQQANLLLLPLPGVIE